MATGISPAAAAAGSAGSASCPWLNESLPISQRVSMLMAQMTESNKINMVTGAGTSEPYVFYIAAIPSLCVPAIGLEDGPVGVGDGMTGVTELPAAVSLAATWDTSLARQYGQVVGAEERGKGAMVNLGPTVNIDRDPRWGRSFEAYSEDPYLSGSMAVADIDGVQSQGEMSQVKHFDAYNQETNRNTPADDAIVTERALHEIYLPSFWAATQESHATSVMCAYSYVNGQPSCGNDYLLKTTLDQRWGYPGFVTSDYGATHSTVGSADAGMDMEMPSAVYYGSALQAAIADGQVAMSTLNEMVRRILTEMFRFNEFNNPPSGSTSDVVTTTAHQAVATSVAEQGTVLLQNRGGALPLSAAGGGKIAVIGPAASASPVYTGGGSAYVTAPFKVSPLQGLQAAAGSGTTVSYTQGLPTDTSLPDISSADLTPAYSGTGFGGSYTGTLTAPQTGTYVLALDNPCDCYTPTYLSLNGKELLDNPGTPPVSTYSVTVHLTAGQSYPLSISGESSSLTWGTPSALAPDIQQAVAAAKSARTAVVVVSDDTETEAADRPSLDLPSAQNELISAVAAANPRTVVVIDTGAPVVMPWLNRVAAVVDAWYPGESNGTALASVLFGQTDPSGHLPVTFPASLAQVPAAKPSEFPGQDGKVHYAEGIDVGYRYYEVHHSRPLFAFGYGLSYTSFKFSNLSVTPESVQNSVSNPGPTACKCNGQSAGMATVSATVTNTGKVAGSDVAQLYLGDPAVSGEPPRQLKGYQKVTLQPGQSTTVRFGLTGHDLSYWDDAANGWVLPDGQYQVYVGDSSALANLPLHGGLAVTRSVGARSATLAGPRTIAPGGTATVTATVVNHGDYAMPGATFTLHAPAGWTVASPAPVTIGAGQTVSEQFRVTAPGSAAPGTRQLTATITSAGLGGGKVVAATSVTVPYAGLAAAYDNTGISSNSDESAANYDGVGDSYSAQALAAGTPTALTAGGRVTIDGTTLTWPDVAAGSPDNIVAAGQTVDLSGHGTDLGFLGASQNGTATGTVTVHYTDGTSQRFTLNLADWYANLPAVGDQVVNTSTWNYQSNPLGAHQVSVYFASVPLAPGKTVASVTLPTVTAAGGTTAMHIFAMAIGTGTPTTGAPFRSLAAAYDNNGISNNSDQSAANYDGSGDSYSAEALAGATPVALSPGTRVSAGGTTFTWPDVAPGTPDNVVADGQVIDVSGHGSDLGFLAASQDGTASGTGIIRYTDGTWHAFGLNIADWYANAPATGDQLLTTSSSWNYADNPSNSAHPVSVYFASVPLAPGKTVASVQLPAVSSGVSGSGTAMHIFAMAIGSGTPTSSG
jgi:beta-glucosidase